jgi:RNA polymerase sigma-70 factor, ECF subfamily
MIGTQLTMPPTTLPSTAVPSLAEEARLVQAAQRDLQAFSALYQQHAHQLYRYLLARVGNADDAQDLASQTFLAAMQGLDSYRQEQPFIAWLLGIARHKVADQFRRSHAEADLDAAEWISDGADDIDDQVGRQIEVEQVARKLQKLSPDRAEALSLRLFGGLEAAEIAQIMEKKESAVRMLIFRGLRDLQQQLIPPNNRLAEEGL